MTRRSAAATASSRLVAAADLVAAVLLVSCTDYYEIPLETPIQPKLDISAFQRVLVAGFLAGGTEDVDGNLETVRLLRSQLRSKSNLKVIEADVLPLAEIAAPKPGSPAGNDGSQVPASSGPPAPASSSPDQSGSTDSGQSQSVPPPKEPPKDVKETKDVKEGKDVKDAQSKIKEEKDLQAYDHIFADVAFWKKLGEEYQYPLIVTGSVVFSPEARSGFVTREREVYDSLGRRMVVPVRTYSERKGFKLSTEFVFIDGRSGTPLHRETFREEVLYNPNQNTPALSSYFELMDRLLPSFLNTLSAQKIRGTRVLLK